MSQLRAVAILQARVGSTRLPGKSLAAIGGQTLLERVVRRVQAASTLAETIVATTTAPADDRIEALCAEWEVPCFRGDEQDVLARFAGAARAHRAEMIVRVNADNPFLASEFIDELVRKMRDDPCDYLSYRVGDKPAMLTPAGLFTEAISADCLTRADRVLGERAHREHVTLGIYQSEELFDVRWLPAPAYATSPALRLTLDTADDLDLYRRLDAALGSDDREMSAEHLCQFLSEGPGWLEEMDRLNGAQPK